MLTLATCWSGTLSYLLGAMWPNSTSTEQWQFYHGLHASRQIWNTCYFEFTEWRQLLKEDVVHWICPPKETRGSGVERSFTFSPNHKNDLLQPPNFPSRIIYTYIHIRLQNKITYIPMTNTIRLQNKSTYIPITNTSYKTNSCKTQRQAGSPPWLLCVAQRYCVAALLHIICFTKINWGYIHKLTINKPMLLIIAACNQYCHYCKRRATCRGHRRCVAFEFRVS